MEAYEKKNVFFLYILSGDQDVPFVHFKKHYRLTSPVISDGMDSLRHVIRVRGIANVAVFGADGVCIHNAGGMGDLDDFRKIIDGALKQKKARGKNLRRTAFVERDTVYPPAVKKQGKMVRERMPSLDAGADGSLVLAYASDESGSNDVFLKIADGKGRWGKPIPIAATGADEYAPSVVATKAGAALVAYVSDEKGRHDVYTVLVKAGEAGRPKRVTNSPDDAMAPCLAWDGKAAWLAWYEWRTMGDLSRDREVFVARSSGAGWSKPVQVSPKDVPAYEDHADPVVRPDGKGGAWVAWAWDYHGTLRNKPPVDENSIFVRHVDRRLKVGDCLAAGWRGEGRARDYMPTIAVTPDGKPWVAWDNLHQASAGYSAKAVFVNRLDGEDFGPQTEVAVNSGPICSPRLLLDREGGVHLLWCQWKGKWEIRLRALGAKGPGDDRPVKVAGRTPRYPTGVFDAKGNLWVAYVDAGEKGWRVRVEKVRR